MFGCLGRTTMTERKPPGTSWETWIETRVRVAMEEGAFDNLPGAGKPLPNFGQEYDPRWWQKQRLNISRPTEDHPRNRSGNADR
jgi:hypothetical protein